MKFSRRQFLKGAVSAGTLFAAGGFRLLLPRRVHAYVQSPLGISKFTMTLPGFGPNGIPVATPWKNKKRDAYNVVAGQFKQVFHPDFLDIYAPVYGNGNFPGSTLWGYASEHPDDLLNGQPNYRYLGGFIIASKGRPVRLQVRNGLVSASGANLSHPVAVDPTSMNPAVMSASEIAMENRIAIHLHGGFVPWISDGGPFAWFTPDGVTGPSYKSDPRGKAPRGAIRLYYPNDESARLLWYHDHAYGNTRINAYVGLATGYLITDETETNLIQGGFIPNLEHTVPLIIQDKSFVPVDGNPQAGSGGRGEPGDLWYPAVYEAPPIPGFASTVTSVGGTVGFQPVSNDTGRWDVSEGTVQPTPSLVPEFFADTTVINGACYPYLEVEQRHYRFLILNACQARFLNLQLYYPPEEAPTEIPLTADPTARWLVPDLSRVKWGPKFVQIGTEGGFLPVPVALNNPPAPFTAQLEEEDGSVIPATMNYTLLLGPAERADLIIDFSDVPVGAKLILYNDAPAPFPDGDPRNDYYTGAPNYSTVGGAATPQAGFGPNTRTLMQLRVVPRTGDADPPQMNNLARIALGGLNSASSASPVSLLGQSADPPPPPAQPRRLALYEGFDEHGRLIQMLGDLSGPTGYAETAGEVVQEGATEVWEIYNTTSDTHPIHLHLVDMEILGRAEFIDDPETGLPVIGPDGAPILKTPLRPPDNNERGEKDTIRMNPDEVTVFRMTFEVPKAPFRTPVSRRLEESFNLKAYEYVWHCHILEHEEHDMMHALCVVPNKNKKK